MHGKITQHWHSASLRCTTGQAVRARRCGDISLAYMDSTSPHIFSGETQDAFERVREAVRTPLYGYGKCCLSELLPHLCTAKPQRPARSS